MIKSKTFLESQNIVSAWMVDDLGRLEGKFFQLEQALYLNRLDEAEELLSEIGLMKGLSIHQMVALAFARAEYSYWRVCYGEAQEHFEGALYLSKAGLNDPFLMARAYYGLARIERKRAHYEAAIELLNQASDKLRGLTGSKVKYLDALIRFNRGVIQEYLGDLTQAEQTLSKAVKDLKAIEGGRFYGIALNSLGITLLHLGRYEEVLSLCMKATDIFSQHAILDDLAHSRYHSAFALVRLRRYQEAERILLDCLELDRRLGDPARESLSLGLLAELSLERGDYLQALQLAKQSVEIGELSQNNYVLAEALIALGRALAFQDRTGAITTLQRALEIATAEGEKRQQIEAYIYLADITSGMDRVQANQYLEAGVKLLEVCPVKYIEPEVENVRKKFAQNPIEIDEDKLTIYRNRLPSWKTAKRSVEMFLLKSALKQTNYSGTETARLLKISKATVTEKRCLYKI